MTDVTPITSVSDYLAEHLPADNARFQHNPVQVAYCDSISEALSHGPDYLHFVEGDTGIGKSLAYLLSMGDWIARGKHLGRRGVISTYSRALQRQLLDEENHRILTDYLGRQGLPPVTLALRMGKANYVSRERLLLALDSHSLIDVANSHERDPAECRIAQWALDSDGCLLDLRDDDLPEGMVLQDIALHESDPVPDELRAHFDEVQSADIQVVNHALLTVDLVTKQAITQTTEPSVLLLDEAEHFPDVAQSILSRRISFGMTRQLLTRLGLKQAATRWKELADAYRSPSQADEAHALTTMDVPALQGGLEMLLKARPRKAKLEETALRHEWEVLREHATEALTAIRQESTSLALTYSSVHGLPSIVVQHARGGGAIKAGASQRITILTSATLSDMGHTPGEPPRFDYLRSNLVMGRTDSRLGVQRSHQALSFGSIDFNLPAVSCRPLKLSPDTDRYHLSPLYVENVWTAISAIEGRTLVLCASYADADVLRECCPASLAGRLTTHAPGAPLNKVAEAMPGNGILATPAGWEGLSPERQGSAFWDHVILLRNPTPPPDALEHLILMRSFRREQSRLVAEKNARRTIMFKNMVRTLHKMRQGIGRGIRHPDDHVTITILDPRFPRPDGANSASVRVMPQLVSAIPARFLMDYEAATSSSPGNEAQEEAAGLII